MHELNLSKLHRRYPINHNMGALQSHLFTIFILLNLPLRNILNRLRPPIVVLEAKLSYPFTASQT